MAKYAYIAILTMLLIITVVGFVFEGERTMYVVYSSYPSRPYKPAEFPAALQKNLVYREPVPAYNSVEDYSLYSNNYYPEVPYYVVETQTGRTLVLRPVYAR